MTRLDQQIVYQIYPLSFQDSNGDGIGDLPGIISRLDYLAWLGVTMLWLTPVYRSPLHDNGYDVADYRSIDPRFGSLADMERLIAEADRRGIGIMMDIVANHTSTEHAWFQQALAGDPHYQAYYVFRDQAFVDAHPVQSIFGGNGWEYVPTLDRYYLHNFDVSQADLDWDNPQVRAEMAAVLDFWLQKGIKGFRFDVIDMISKQWDPPRMAAGPRLHDYIRELNGAFAGRAEITVGETWSADLAHMRRYSNPDGSEFSMVFNFEHLGFGHDKWTSSMDPTRLQQVLAHYQQALHGQGWNSLFLGNHDLPRPVSRFGCDSDCWRALSARQWAILLHGLQGTPFIYQGEEIGMRNRIWQTAELRDVEALNYLAEQAPLIGEEEALARLSRMGRDNARLPMAWSHAPQGGFSTATPWIRAHEDYPTINVAAQQTDPDSVLATYRALIALRKQLPILREGDFALLTEPGEHYFCYQRRLNGERLLVLANLTTESQPLPVALPEVGQRLIGNYPDHTEATLRPLETLIWHLPA